MKGFHVLRTAALAMAALVLSFSFTACHSASHPDDSAAVYNAFDQHDLASVQIIQDRDKGVITLRGIVGDQARKDRAQQLAQQAAPGYTIQNNLQVDNSSVLGMANPNAKPPEVQQMAHPPATDSNAAPQSSHPKRHSQK